jgi:hypothetical protein
VAVRLCSLGRIDSSSQSVAGIGGKELRRDIHERACKIRISQKKVVFQSQEVKKQLGSIKEDVKEPLTRDFVSCVGGFL